MFVLHSGNAGDLTSSGARIELRSPGTPLRLRTCAARPSLAAVMSLSSGPKLSTPRNLHPALKRKAGYRGHILSCPYLSRQFFVPRLIRIGKGAFYGAIRETNSRALRARIAGFCSWSVSATRLSDYQTPVLGIEDQGSSGGSAGPRCRSSIEIPSGERTNAMCPSRGGRLIVTPPFISLRQAA